MIRSGLRKATIAKNDLPPLSKLGPDSFGYLTRYRIISEDRNRFSHWSPVFAVEVFDFENLPGQVSGTINIIGNAITIIWDDEIDRPRYDVFVKFDEGEYFYHGTSPIHTYSIINTQDATEIFAAIQIESVNKERSDVLTICEVSASVES
jgi:hypothetical protein